MHKGSPQSLRSQRTFKIEELELSREEKNPIYGDGDSIPGDAPAGDDTADYSTRLGEILGDDDENDQGDTAAGSDGEGESFFYAGADAPILRGSYDAQLKDVLGPEEDGETAQAEQESQVMARLGVDEDEDEFDYLRYKVSDNHAQSYVHGG